MGKIILFISILFTVQLNAQEFKIVYGDNAAMEKRYLVVEESQQREFYDLKPGVQDGHWKIYRTAKMDLLKTDGNIVDGKKEGTWTYYDKKGSKARVINYTKGVLNGEEVYYNTKNGTKLLVYNYQSGLRAGTYFLMHANGQKWEEGQYDNGLPEGEWKYWNKEGELISERIFRRGELIHQKTYKATK